MNVTAVDVVTIIKACRASGVKKIKFETLEMEFDTEKHPNKTKNNASRKDVESTGDVGHPLGPLLSDTEKLPEYLDEEVLMNEMADQLVIENPAEYEQLQIAMMNKGST